ncbi:MAG: cell wall metabolism sensor histidine kinase WalK [Anaerolineales bacterium]|nr:cell wall metabolism sensor histidine kinase WalK [Anaerolineales bacterium]
MLSFMRSRLGWKIFLSYLIVILVGVIVLATAAEFVVPSAFDRHMAAMGTMMSGMMDTTSMGMDLNADLFSNFRTAVNEALILATLAALMASLIVSIFVSRRVVAPVSEMMVASRRIAKGHYEERVYVGGDVARGEQDELGQLALSFNQMAEKLEKTETIRRQLIGDVTHELRTPLTTIKGSMEGLIDGVLTAEVETYQQIYREADRLSRLVDDLQELSRVESGAYILNLKTVSVSDLVAAAITRLGRQFEEKGVYLHSEVSSDLPRVKVDVDRIGQVLLNLVGNALQYTPSGGEVFITAERQSDEIQFAISDTGIGIPAEHLSNLFTRFYRVDKSRSRAGGGSGIGLTISKHLVEAHEGRIWVESPGAGKGSTFMFTLPIQR